MGETTAIDRFDARIYAAMGDILCALNANRMDGKIGRIATIEMDGLTYNSIRHSPGLTMGLLSNGQGGLRMCGFDLGRATIVKGRRGHMAVTIDYVEEGTAVFRSEMECKPQSGPHRLQFDFSQDIPHGPR